MAWIQVYDPLHNAFLSTLVAARPRRVLDEYERALREGRGAIAVDGKMVDAASLRMARNLVEKDRLARAR